MALPGDPGGVDLQAQGKTLGQQNDPTNQYGTGLSSPTSTSAPAHPTAQPVSATHPSTSAAGISAADWALVRQVAAKYKIDPYVLVAIGLHETGWGRLGAGRSGYALGVGVPDSGGKISKYQGLAAQLEGAAVILQRNGVHTIADIAAGKLAPTGGKVKYASDPRWSSSVVAEYNKVSGSTFTGTVSTAAGTGSGGSGAGTTATPADPNAQVSINTYSYIAALAKSEPDLADLMKKYAGEDLSNEAVQQRLQADIQNTHWWRSHNNDYRKAEIQKAQDPASYQRAVNDQVAGVTQAARAYLIPMDEHTARVWASRLASGLITPDDYKNYLKEQGKSLFPGMAAAIDSGVTPETYVQPYKTLAAQTLEIPPESVNFLTPKWGKALFQVDPKTGARTSMSLADWQNTLRSDPMYGFDRTEQARTTAADLTTQLGHAFGAL